MVRCPFIPYRTRRGRVSWGLCDRGCAGQEGWKAHGCRRSVQFCFEVRMTSGTKFARLKKLN